MLLLHYVYPRISFSGHFTLNVTKGRLGISPNTAAQNVQCTARLVIRRGCGVYWRATPLRPQPCTPRYALCVWRGLMRECCRTSDMR